MRKLITKASFYGANGEKGLNEHVAMLSSEICPECKGSTEQDECVKCSRCNGDGYLTNQIKFNPHAPACACNMFPLGTWLKVTYLEFYKDKPYMVAPSKEIIVMVTDRMASWLNSDNGKWEYVCNECHSKYSGDITQYGKKHLCGGEFVKTRDIDLTAYGAFKKVAPLSIGLINVELEVL